MQSSLPEIARGQQILDGKQVRELNKKFELEDTGISLPDDYWSVDYQCPLCPGHVDNEDDFAWSKLLDAPTCRGCTYDIHNGFVGWDDKPTSEQYNHADTIEKLEQLTGRTFQQLKFQYLRDKIIEWSGTAPELTKDVVIQGMADSDLRDLNKKLNHNFLEIVESKKGKTK